VLTDSFSWTFYYFAPEEGSLSGGDLYQSSEYIANNPESQAEILGKFL